MRIDNTCASCGTAIATGNICQDCLEHFSQMKIIASDVIDSMGIPPERPDGDLVWVDRDALGKLAELVKPDTCERCGEEIHTKTIGDEYYRCCPDCGVGIQQ